MKEIKIYFVAPGISQYTYEIFAPFLLKYYNVILDPISPEYVIYSLHSYSKKEASIFDYPKAIKIFFSGENAIPDFNISDYAMSASSIIVGDRHHRVPLWFCNYLMNNYYEKESIQNIEDSYANRKFCNFIYSNSSSQNSIREELFHKLSEYKKVDSGGKMLNNIGGCVERKMEFIENYKFTLAIENADVDGYITEKIIEPKVRGSVPIYWGNSAVLKDFNPKAFIYVNDFNSLDDLKDYIEYLDNNSEEYLKILREPILLKNDLMRREQELKDFFDNIFNQDKQQAKRVNTEGWLKQNYQEQYIFSKIKKQWWWKYLLKVMVKYRWIKD